MRHRIKKFSIAAVVSIFLFVNIFASFAFVNPALATPTSEVASVPWTVSSIMDKIYEAVKGALINAGIRAATYALRKVAYDSAVWVASGGKGQSPLAHTQGFGGYLQSVGDEAAGAFIEDLSKSAGMDLCKVPDIKIDLAMKVGLRTNFGGKQAKPSCSLTAFKKNVLSGSAWSRYDPTNGNILKNFNASITADDSDLGIYFQATEKINQKVAQQKEAAVYNRLEGQGYKPLSERISDTIKTPAQNIGKTFQSLNPEEEFKKSEAQLNAAVASGDIKVFPALLGIFLSTLGGTIINNFQTKGMLPFGLCVGGLGGDACKGSGGTGSDGSALTADNPLFNESSGGFTTLGRAAAQSFFSYFTEVKIKEANRYDLISQLNSCPDVPGVYNCRAGDDLINAAQQQITIGDAIKRGILDGNKKLIPPTERDKNSDINCYRDAYCLSNVKVLRQVRILPVGFELAVKRSPEGRPATLKEVVEAFNSCPPNITAATPLTDYDNFKYCHLIDPNWVLKVPQAKCDALVYTNQLMDSEVPTRLQDCVDLKTCVNYTIDGNCADYAYCVKEKNTWAFASDECNKQFASCRAYKAGDGRTVSYLDRTLDKSYCTEANAGCTAYSLTQNQRGQWTTTTFDFARGENTGVFLNAKAETGCSFRSAGCSAFTLAKTEDVSTLFLKKAPDYLGCYDSNPTTPNTIEWPETTADLSRIVPNDRCNDYAKACTAEEADCNWYTPVSGGVKVPGRFVPAEITGNTVTWNDQCDGRCDGYNVYKELPSNYSTGTNLAYIIPSSGEVCTAEEEGCSSFTNLSTTIGGVENTEYFSYLRPCITMQEASSTAARTFVTYEGSKDTGFQLQTFVMIYNTGAEVPANGPIGSPRYVFKDTDELAYLNAECTEQRYKDGVASLDCRQFNDQNGNTYYRMLSHLAPAHEKCSPYRLNDPDFYLSGFNQADCSANHGFWDTGFNVCRMCLQGGEYRNGACIYEGLPGNVIGSAGSSRSCAAEKESCRAYKGNAGNNIQTVFSENFESPSSTDGWTSGARLEMVSTRVGEHSLEYDNAGVFGKTLTLELGKSYDLTFWANAGRSSNLTVSLISGGTTNRLGVVSVGSGWRQFKVGPVELTGNDPNVQLAFDHNLAGAVFIDNIRLTKVASLLYLVKNTLKVDPVCDSHPEDNLPGEALGCTAYTDPQNRKFYLTNFSFLCREEAIGCTALFDTFNTESKNPEAYRLWLAGAPGQFMNVPATLGTGLGCKVSSSTYDNGCFVDVFGHTLAEITAAMPGSIVTSTIYIKSDTPSNTPIYLVANKGASCGQEELGCTLAGKRTFSAGVWTYQTTTIKNDPASYKDVLCESPAEGCRGYSAGTEISYFKDPSVSGQNTCTYKEDVPYNGVTVSGWFRKDPIGVCSNDPNRLCDRGALPDVCAPGGVCQNAPCYPGYDIPRYSENVHNYGIYSYNTPQYDRFVGECPAEQDKCTEFRDPVDIVDGLPTSYFMIKNERLGEGDCNGQVSRKYGCALFQEVGYPPIANRWDAALSYAESDRRDGIRVVPSTSGLNDTNILIRVAQDRKCGEWIECSETYSGFDTQKGSYVPICTGNLSRCSAVNQKKQCDPSAIPEPMLTEGSYRARTVGWSGMDYDGYSILDVFPVDQIAQINFTNLDNAALQDYKLGLYIDAGSNNASNIGNVTAACLNVGEPCGDALPSGVIPGICLPSKLCVQTSIGNVATTTQICRAYPESDSPFPATPKVKTSQMYRSANICDSEIPGLNGLGCECYYKKVEYGDIVKRYWNIDQIGPDRTLGRAFDATTPTPYPYGICYGGVSLDEGGSNGLPCLSDDDCDNFTTPGVCGFKKRVTTLMGWPGYCLEEDASRHINSNESENQCITWFPVKSIAGAPAINNQQLDAGNDWRNVNTTGGGNYCINSSGQDASKSFTINFSPLGVNTDPGNTDDGYGTAANAMTYRRCKSCWFCSCQYTYRHFSWYFDRSHIDTTTGLTSRSNKRITGIDATFAEIRKEDIESVIVSVNGAEGNYAPTGGSEYIFPNTGVAQNGPYPGWQVPTYEVPRRNLSSGGSAGGLLMGAFFPLYNNNFVMLYTPQADNSPGFNMNTVSGEYTYNMGYGGIHGFFRTDQAVPLGVDVSGSRVDLWDTSRSNGMNGSAWPPPPPPVTDPQGGNYQLVLGSYRCDPAWCASMGYSADCLSELAADPNFGPNNAGNEFTAGYCFQVPSYVNTVTGEGFIDSTMSDPSTTTPYRYGRLTVVSPTTSYHAVITLGDIPGNRPAVSTDFVFASEVGELLRWQPTAAWTPGWEYCGLRHERGEEFQEDNSIPWNAMRFTFDPVDHRFTGIDTAFCGKNGAGIGTCQHCSPTGLDQITYTVRIKLRETCRAYADATIDQNDTNSRTIAWTDRLFSVQDPPADWRVPALNWSYNSITQPFGNFGTTRFDATSLTDPRGGGTNPITLRPAVTGGSGTGFDCVANGTGILGCGTSANLARQNYFAEGQTYGPPPENINYGAARLSTLFASVDGTYQSVNGGPYNSVQPLGNRYSNVTESGDSVTGVTPNPPRVYPKALAPQPAYLNRPLSHEEMNFQGFSVNGTFENVIETTNPSLRAELQFFMYADPNQMPIRRVSVDWDNGQIYTSKTGFFRNKRGLLCDASGACQFRCNPRESAANFGSIVDMTCDNGYFEFTNNYSCGGPGSPGYEASGVVCAAGTTLLSNEFPRGCCIFHPRIQVQDNWGWCNGRCAHAISPGMPNAGTVIPGCYNPLMSDPTGGGINDCRLENGYDDPWQRFVNASGRQSSIIIKY